MTSRNNVTSALSSLQIVRTYIASA